MPIGGFLDSLPALLFIGAHIVFIVVGIWAWRRSIQSGLPFSSVFLLYIISQIGFLAFFGGVMTLKLAVLFDQTLILILVILLVRKRAT